MPPRHIYLFTSVNPMSAELIVRQLFDYDRQNNEPITMFINSPGGSVIDFFAIYNAIELIKSPVNTFVMGTAASASAILAAIGKERFITEDSEFMLHEVWSFIIGSVSEVKDQSDRMEKMQKRLMDILSSHTGKSIDQLESAMKKGDRYFTAKQAVSFGLADKVIKSDEAQVLKLSEGIHSEGNEFIYKDGVPEVELLCEGKYIHPVYGEITLTEDIFGRMKDNFDRNVRGIDISIDYTHDNENGEEPAACWIKELGICLNSKSKKVLKAKVEFTPKGKKLVTEKEYKYASADFVMNYRDERGKHHPYVLCGGTLTNRPFIKELNPIKLSEHKTKQKEINQMNKEALIVALKEQGVDVVMLQGQYDSQKAEIQNLQNKIKELSALPAQKENEIANLKTQLETLNSTIVKNEKEQVFNSLLEEGKVIPAQKDNILGVFDTAEKMKNFYKDAPVIVKTKPKGSNEEGENGLTAEENKLVNDGVYTKEQIIAGRTNRKPVTSGK